MQLEGEDDDDDEDDYNDRSKFSPQPKREKVEPKRKTTKLKVTKHRNSIDY